jgi:hypothetical protein
MGCRSGNCATDGGRRCTEWTVGRSTFLPWFGHDIAALFTNRYFVTDGERRMARQFRWYMAGYMTLLTLIVGLP